MTIEYSELDFAKEVMLFALPFLFGYMVAKWQIKNSMKTILLNDLIQDVRDIENKALIYWTRSYNEEYDPQIEAHFRGFTVSLLNFRTTYVQHIQNKNPEFSEFIVDLMDRLTGGEFETKNRSPDYERAVDIKSLCGILVNILRNARGDTTDMITDLFRYFLSLLYFIFCGKRL